MKAKVYLLTFLVAMSGFGCATARMYQGEKLPNEQTATLKVSRSHYVYFPPTFIGISGIDVLAIDTESTHSRVPKLIPDEAYARIATRIEVLPGFHRLYVVTRKEVGTGSNWTGPMKLYEMRKNLCLEFNTEAGREYKIKVPYWWREGSIVRVVDVGSGEVVASETIK